MCYKFKKIFQIGLKLTEDVSRYTTIGQTHKIISSQNITSLRMPSKDFLRNHTIFVSKFNGHQDLNKNRSLILYGNKSIKKY
jgi:hypothetical protein